MSSKLMQILDDQDYIDRFYPDGCPGSHSDDSLSNNDLSDILEDSDIEKEPVSTGIATTKFKDRSHNNLNTEGSELEDNEPEEEFSHEERYSLTSVERKVDIDYIAHKCYTEIINYFKDVGLEIGTFLTYPKFYDWFLENTRGGYKRY